MATRSSNIDVRLRLQGARTFAAQLAGARAQLEAMGVKGAGALSSFAAQAGRLKSFGSTMSRNVSLPLVGVAALGAKTAIDFTRSMNQVGVALDVPPEKLSGLHDLAVTLGAETVFSANDAAEAMLELAKGGMTEAQIRGGALKSTMTNAAAGGLELADSAKLISSTMNTFGLGAKDSTKITDALAGAANASSADMGDLGMSLTQAGQGAVNAGLNINETAGALAAFADNGIRGSDAGTSLKTMLARLNPQSEKAKGLMRELGLDFYDAQGNAKSLTGITDELTQAFGPLTQEQRSAAMQTIFGSDATRAASVLFREGEGSIQKYIDATKERGAAQKMADAQMEGLPGAWESLKGSLETAALVIGEALAPSLEAVAGFIGKVVNAFTDLDPKLQSAIVGFGAFVAAIGPLSWALGGLAGSLGKMLIVLPRVVAAFRNFIVLVRMVGLVNAMSAAVKLLGISLKTALKGTIILALVTAVILLNEKFHFLGPILDFILKTGKTVFAWLKQAAMDAANWISGAWKRLQPIIIGVWNAIKTAAVVAWKVISTAVKIAWGVIKAVTLPLRTWMKVVFTVIATTAKVAWKVITTAVKVAWTLIKAYTLPARIALAAAFKAIKAVAIPVWNTIKSVAKTVFDFLKGVAEPVVHAIKSAMEGIGHWIGGAFNTMKGVVIDVVNFIIARINDVLGVINSAISAFNKLPGPDIGEIGTIGEIPTAGEIKDAALGDTSDRAADTSGSSDRPAGNTNAPKVPTSSTNPKIDTSKLNPKTGDSRSPKVENHFYVDGREVAFAAADQADRARARR